ncbi:MAG: hypothetical protein B6U68_00790 [Candidatus Aenigmarchaeota archaeon ex4484_14]|nr:MAG: hypothetical protein B6U68_00790 [Candidatus Aenigmarchaeota archaeon ex4484_14]
MDEKLKIKFIPYEVLKNKRTRDLISDLKKNTIIIVDAKLMPREEARLIRAAMKKISSKFSGIELNSLELSEIKKDKTWSDVIKEKIIEIILGKKRGMTIIGPADIIKKIEKDPTDLLLFMK